MSRKNNARRLLEQAKATRQPRAAVLPIKPIPDMAKRATLRQLADLPPVSLPGTPKAHLPGIVDELTEEQRAIRDAGLKADGLLKGDERFRNLVGSMIAFRQAYAVAYRELQTLVGAEREQDPHCTPMLEDFLVQYAMFCAAKPFTEHELMRSVVDTVLPWLADAIDRHSEADEEAARAERQEEDEQRKAQPIPLGFKHSAHCAEPVLERERTLVLVGWRNAVSWLLDQIESVALDNKPVLQLVRFLDAAPRQRESQARLVRLPPKAWAGCANSDRTMAVCLVSHVEKQLTRPVDLLLIDNLADAYTGGLAFRPAAASAGDAHKRLRKWCDMNSAGLVAVLPLDEKGDPDVTEPCYEQLRTFATVRPVRVLEDAAGDTTKYRLRIGNDDAVVDVEKAVLDACGRSTIALPGGLS